jgi:hypothetical protein
VIKRRDPNNSKELAVEVNDIVEVGQSLSDV